MSRRRWRRAAARGDRSASARRPPCPSGAYGLRAIPHARLQPEERIYEGHVSDALRNAAKLWHGLDAEGLDDRFATAVRMRFSRPMPFQIDGDPMGERTEIVLRAAHETVHVVDWRSAFSNIESPVSEADLACENDCDTARSSVVLFVRPLPPDTRTRHQRPSSFSMRS